VQDFVLSDEQQRAVSSASRAIVVVAGAGCGKTEIVARRIERLLLEESGSDYRILAVTYTVKAADEMRARLSARLGDLHRRVDADTIHGFALTLLRQYGTRIGLPSEPEIVTKNEDRAELLASWLSQSGQDVPSNLASVLEQIDLARATCSDAPFLEDWRAAMSAIGALDYPAMVDRACELLDSRWVSTHLQRLYGHLFVDEAQNLLPAQYRLLARIIGAPSTAHIRAVIVGDERQSIVGFAGADSRLIGQFESSYGAERIELHTNYRSARRIRAFAQRISAALNVRTSIEEALAYPAKGRVDVRTYDTEAEEGRKVAKWAASLINGGLDPDILAPGEPTVVRPEHIAILARAGGTLLRVRDALNALGIPNASATTEDDWVSSSAARVLVELLAYRSAPEHVSTRRRLARLCNQTIDQWSDLTELIVSSPDPDIAVLADSSNATTPAELVSSLATLKIRDPDWADDLHQIEEAWGAFIDRHDTASQTFGNFRQHVARCQRGQALDAGVRLLTVHKSQGQEFKAVCIVACNDGQFPDFRATEPEQAVAELRTFYVAVSRAARVLRLTRSQVRTTRYGERETTPSPFLAYARRS